jgi:hypothetical protein
VRTPQASVHRIIKYKTCLDVLYVYTVQTGAKISKDELDNFLKHETGLDAPISCTDLSSSELDDLIECTYLYAEQIGCELKESSSEKIKLNFNRGV